VLNNVRIIFELSKHYNNTDKIKALLSKIGNQIIRRCCKKINKDDMLNGDVEKCMRDLDESIDCCEQWIKICTRTLKIIKLYTTSTVKFDIDPNNLKDATFFQETIGF
jgi:dynein heavy chain